MIRSSAFSGPKFLVPSSPNKRNANATDSDFLIPSCSTRTPDPSLSWDEKYAPTKESDLAVRVQKINELKYYINSSAISNTPGQYKMLVLTGPSGVGKSTTLRVVAKSMGYDIIEWKNQQQDNLQNGHFDPDYEPTMDKFSRFLHRSIHTPTFTTDRRKPRIILMDDIPDLTTSYIKQEFQSLLKTYLDSNCAFLIVLIHSVAQMATEFGRTRNYSRETQLINLNDLMTNDIRLTGRCGTIEFNPIIKRSLKLTLSNILKSEAKFSKHPSISQQQLEHITESCHGDIRSAILAMQFSAINPYTHTKKRRLNPDSVDTSSVTSRENPLEFFHAVGKALYAKRTPSGALESKPAVILEKARIDGDQYLAFLYSNYPSMLEDIDDISAGMDCLCDADMLGGMGVWNDDLPMEYQLLTSMFGVMAVERSPEVLARKFQLKGPGPEYYRSKSTETPRSTAPIVSTTPLTSINDKSGNQDMMEPIENENGELWDNIGGQNDDDDDEFDDIYGDGGDLDFLDNIP